MPAFEKEPANPFALIPPSRRESFKHRDEVPFRRVVAGPSKADAYWMAEAALLAYARPEGNRWFAHASKAFKTAFSAPLADATKVSVRHGAGRKRGTNWYLISANEFNLLVFRGSEVPGQINDLPQLGQVLRDWVVTNAQFLPSHLGNGARAHEGFTEAYAEVAPAIDKALRESVNPNARLFITGHSLGGAMAVLAAASLQNFFGTITCYTFGAPRVGDRGFARMLANVAMFRYELGDDLVTRVPPRAFGYQHVPMTAIHYNSVDSGSTTRWDIPLSDTWYSLSLGYMQLKSASGTILDQVADKQLSKAALSALRPLVDHAPVLYAIAAYNDWVRG
ncbi:lipase family protein [Ahniella affigens]|nr:lipase family protein [Ahniella affigens]